MNCVIKNCMLKIMKVNHVRPMDIVNITMITLEKNKCSIQQSYCLIQFEATIGRYQKLMTIMNK